MRALTYLMIHTLKNRILQLKKKPVLLVLYLLFAVMIISMFVMYTFVGVNENHSNYYADNRILYSIVAAIGLLFTYIFINTGLSTGGTLFSMADVSLLFVSPVTTRRILFYGLIKQLGTTFLTSIFIVFQLPNLINIFQVDALVIINIFIIYAVIIFFCQLLSMGIYVFSNGNSARKNIIKGIFYGAICIIGAVVFLQYRETGNILESVLSITESKTFGFVPIAGWATMFIKAAVEQNIVFMVVPMLLFLVSTMVVIACFTAGEADYYEDVLLSTELNFNKQQAAKEGKRTASTKKIKVNKEQTGIKKGRGASVIFYKHMLEMRRNNKISFIDKYTIVAAAGAGILCYLVKEPFAGVMALGILVYVLFFFTVMGGLSVELMKPYIYMIPEKSIHKLIAASMASILKPCIDGVIIFTVVAVVLGTSPLENLFLAIAYAATGVLFISFTIVCQKYLGTQPSKLITAFFGIGLFCLIITPAVAVGVVAAVLLPSSLIFLATLPYTLCCILVTVIVFAICGDIFYTSEFTGKM